MLRADMDALPLAEETGRPFASRVSGARCTHAVTTATSRCYSEPRAPIAERRSELAGTIVLCFQPAEEGKGGAQLMVDEGLIERFRVERAYGLHLFSQLETGVLGFREGPFYASSDSIEIRIDGFGGHGAAPHLSIDPILVAAEFVASVQKVVSRQDRSDRTGRGNDRCDPRRHDAQRDPVERDVARHRARVRCRRSRTNGGANRARPQRRVRCVGRHVRVRVRVALSGHVERRRADRLRARARRAYDRRRPRRDRGETHGRGKTSRSSPSGCPRVTSCWAAAAMRARRSRITTVSSTSTRPRSRRASG